MQTAKQMAIKVIRSSSQAITNSFTLENCTRGNALKLTIAAAATYAGIAAYGRHKEIIELKNLDEASALVKQKEWINITEEQVDTGNEQADTTEEQENAPEYAEKTWFGSLPQEFEELLKNRKFYQKFAMQGIKPHNSYLLHGALGSGKALAVLELSKILGISLVQASSRQFMTLIRDSKQDLGEFFQTIIKNTCGDAQTIPFNCIIFIDKIGHNCDNIENREENCIINDIFSVIANENKNILFIGATNFINKIDPELKSDRRLIQVKVEFPTGKAQVSIITYLLHKYNIYLDRELFNTDYFFEKTKWLSKIVIDSIITDALKNCIMNEKNPEHYFIEKFKILLDNYQKEMNPELMSDDVKNMYI